MELIEGASLAKSIGPGGFGSQTADPHSGSSSRERQKTMARLMSQIARAVDYAHKHGVLHRDLKPANIILDAQGEPHVADFGLAKLLGRAGVTGTEHGEILGTPPYVAPELAAGNPRHAGTEQGTILGSPPYMPPELADGRTGHASTASDIYSLGAILYEMLTGRPPFHGDTQLETLRRVVEEEVIHPSSFNPEVDAESGRRLPEVSEKGSGVPLRQRALAG